MKALRFEVAFVANDGIFPNVNSPVQGYVRLCLKKPLEIQYLMVGWSTRCHSEEVIEGKTRIGKQIYIEKVQFLIGETDSKELHYMEAKEHVFQFEIPNHIMDDTDGTFHSTAKLSWHNLKVALVDKDEDVYYADIVGFEDTSPSCGSTEMHSVGDADTRGLINMNPKLSSSENLYLDTSNQKHALNGNEGVAFKYGSLDVRCRLHKPCFAIQDIISFTVQCRNNAKRGFRQLSATLVKRHTKKERNRGGSTTVASVVGPAVAPKEIVLWNGQLMPSHTERDSECWYTLKVVLKNKFSAKFIIRMPVVITDDPLTPT